jgi:DNA-binding SARP family transcriptional activator
MQSAPAAGGSFPDPAGQLPGFWLGVLGALTVYCDGVEVAPGRPRVREALGLLALHANSVLHRDALIDALWGEDPPRTAPVMVQHYIGEIRRLAGPERPPQAGPALLISSPGAGYRLRLTDEQADHLMFRRLTAEAGKARAGGQLEAACGLYSRALGLWRGA